MIPSQALQAGQQGAYVFVVKPGATVETRRVVTTRSQGDETVIGSGLEGRRGPGTPAGMPPGQGKDVPSSKDSSRR